MRIYRIELSECQSALEYVECEFHVNLYACMGDFTKTSVLKLPDILNSNTAFREYKVGVV